MEAQNTKNDRENILKFRKISKKEKMIGMKKTNVEEKQTQIHAEFHGW